MTAKKEKREKGAFDGQIAGGFQWSAVKEKEKKKRWLCTFENMIESQGTGSFMLFQLGRHESAALLGNNCNSCIGCSYFESTHQRLLKKKTGLTSVDGFDGVGLRVAPPPPHPALQPEGAALVIEPPPLLQGAQQLVEGLWEVRG